MYILTMFRYSELERIRKVWVKLKLGKLENAWSLNPSLTWMSPIFPLHVVPCCGSFLCCTIVGTKWMMGRRQVSDPSLGNLLGQKSPVATYKCQSILFLAHIFFTVFAKLRNTNTKTAMPPKTSQWPMLGQLVRSTASKFRQQCSVLSTFSSQIKQSGHQVLFGGKRRFVSAVGKESVVDATSAVAKFEFEAFNWFLLAITRAAENRNWLHFYCR